MLFAETTRTKVIILPSAVDAIGRSLGASRAFLVARYESGKTPLDSPSFVIERLQGVGGHLDATEFTIRLVFISSDYQKSLNVF